MSVPHTQETTVPATLDSPRAKLVYLALSSGGPATPDELCERLAIPKLSLLAILQTLQQREHVVREDDRYHPA